LSHVATQCIKSHFVTCHTFSHVRRYMCDKSHVTRRHMSHVKKEKNVFNSQLENDDYNCYFRFLHVNSIIFVVIFAYSSTCFAKFPRIRKIKFEYEKKTVSSFAKMENPEKKSFRIALVCGFNFRFGSIKHGAVLLLLNYPSNISHLKSRSILLTQCYV